MARVGVVFGGRSVEHEVSVRSARTVVRGLIEAGHEVVPLGIGPDGRWIDGDTSASALSGELSRLPTAAGGSDADSDAGTFAGTSAGGGAVLDSLSHLLGAFPEVIFPIVHGTWGEDGTLQGFFEILDLPYVGAGVTASALAMDKLLAKRQLDAEGLPVLPWRGIRREDFEADPGAFAAECGELGYPLFVKPSVGGSSVGVRKVPDPACFESSVRFALRFDDSVLVERAVAGGRELECAVLGYRRLEASELGEIVPGNEFYDYEDKYLTDDARLIAPAELEPEESDRLRDLACRAFAALGGTGLARVDFLKEVGDDGAVWINEINTLPGFTEISMYPRLWGVSGLPLPDLVDRLVTVALERHRDRKRLDEGIKEWLAGLG
jgi:D-alanine-D-alanine ligase